jgi:transposase
VLIKTLLNKCHPIKCFVYGATRLEKVAEVEAIIVEVAARSNSRAVCSECGEPGPTYDHLEARRFEFIPLWGWAVFLEYRMRRVSCKECGVKAERVPFGDAKHSQCPVYRSYLAAWAKRLPWQETAEVFRTSWGKVFRAVEWAVEYGLEHRDLSEVKAIGVDEVAWQKGHHYLTVVYQLDEGRRRLLWVGQERTTKTLLRFFHFWGKERTARLEFVCSDMWRPYLKVLAKKAGHAVHILDRFHIMANLNKALDQVRAEEMRALRAKGQEALLVKSRWCLLKRPGNLLPDQATRLKDLLRINLRTVRAYLLRESFSLFWDYTSPYWAGRYMDRWCSQAMRSKIEPMKKMARSFRTHRPLILNWFKAKKQFSSGIVEGLNGKLKLTFRRAFGFSTYKAAEIALYHTLGDLPEPKFTHRFC